MVFPCFKMQLHATVMNARHRKRCFTCSPICFISVFTFCGGLYLCGKAVTYDQFVGKREQRRLIVLMPEVLWINMVLKNGESILFVKLIFHKGLSSMKMDTTAAVLPFRFLKVCKKINCAPVKYSAKPYLAQEI